MNDPRTMLVVMVAAIVLVAALLIRRAGAELRGQLRDRRRQGPALTPEQVRAITAQGLATAEQLFAMSAKEQQMLAATAVMLEATKGRGQAS